MTKLKALNIILIITCIEIVACVVFAWNVLSDPGIELGAIVFGFLFGVIILYYLIYLLVLARYAQKRPANPNIWLIILLNLLPVIGFVILL
jgi:multisubunit Na+/H+ antiporter MnhE subunit